MWTAAAAKIARIACKWGWGEKLARHVGERERERGVVSL
jgi:hypothetical protein